MNKLRKHIVIISVLTIIGFLGANCKSANFEKGELVGDGGRSFRIKELDRKTLYHGKRVQFVGYFDDHWSQRGKEVSLLLEEERGNYDSLIWIIKLNEGRGENEIFLGKTGASEMVVGNQIKGSRMQREEFIAEDMRVYDNDGNSHPITQKFAVSATVEYSRDDRDSFRTYQDPSGATN